MLGEQDITSLQLFEITAEEPFLRRDTTVLPTRMYGFASGFACETSVKLASISLQNKFALSPRTSLFGVRESGRFG